MTPSIKLNDGTSEHHFTIRSKFKNFTMSHVWLKVATAPRELIRQARGDAATFSVCVCLKDNTPDVREFPPEVSWKSQLGHVVPEGGDGGGRSTRLQRFSLRRAAQSLSASLPRVPAVNQRAERLRIVFIVSSPRGRVETERVVTLLQPFFLQMLRNTPIK